MLDFSMPMTMSTTTSICINVTDTTQSKTVPCSKICIHTDVRHERVSEKYETRMAMVPIINTTTALGDLKKNGRGLFVCLCVRICEEVVYMCNFYIYRFAHENYLFQVTL